jgi:hypothetical protein
MLSSGRSPLGEENLTSMSSKQVASDLSAASQAIQGTKTTYRSPRSCRRSFLSRRRQSHLKSCVIKQPDDVSRGRSFERPQSALAYVSRNSRAALTLATDAEKGKGSVVSPRKDSVKAPPSAEQLTVCTSSTWLVVQGSSPRGHGTVAGG